MTTTAATPQPVAALRAWTASQEPRLVAVAHLPLLLRMMLPVQRGGAGSPTAIAAAQCALVVTHRHDCRAICTLLMCMQRPWGQLYDLAVQLPLSSKDSGSRENQTIKSFQKKLFDWEIAHVSVSVSPKHLCVGLSQSRQRMSICARAAQLAFITEASATHRRL